MKRTHSLGCVTRRSVLAGKSSYFAAIAANGHRTPAAAARARIVVEEQATVRIGTKPKARASPLGDNFSRGSGHRGEQPIKASLPRNEFDLPDTILSDEFIVPRSEEHTSELQSHHDLVCRLLLEKKNNTRP